MVALIMSTRSPLVMVLLIVLVVCFLTTIHAQTPPENDHCEGSLVLNADSELLEGSTVDSTPEELNLCGATAASKRGIWYLYQNSSIPQGSTQIVTASTCTDSTDFDTALTVYEGFCEGLNCVHGADDDTECGTGGGQHTTISWHAESGTRYYLLVHGSQVNHTGNFGLKITTEEPLESVDPGEYANQGDSGAISTSFRMGWVGLLAVSPALLLLHW